GRGGELRTSHRQQDRDADGERTGILALEVVAEIEEPPAAADPAGQGTERGEQREAEEEGAGLRQQEGAPVHGSVAGRISMVCSTGEREAFSSAARRSWTLPVSAKVAPRSACPSGPWTSDLIWRVS